MSASLVGSEMCIRDSSKTRGQWEDKPLEKGAEARMQKPNLACSHRAETSVSYTHLTLPTICSV
eukprot:3681993-Alexandrium_andersonii.AAC.1